MKEALKHLRELEERIENGEEVLTIDLINARRRYREAKRNAAEEE